MCGVAGIVGAGSPEDEKLVRTMNSVQRHRGPDDAGFWSSGGEARGQGVMFGHRRLSIVDLSMLGHQPTVDPGTGCAVVYNGEIYNFRALRAELTGLGHQFESDCDTEVLLRGWVEWGESVVPRLEGMFAFAVWDPRADAVFLIRDRLGIKPLYYALAEEVNGQRGLLFASEVRALLETGRVARTFDPMGLSSYLWNGFVVGPNTILEGVRLLDAGSILRVEPDGSLGSIRRYWTLPLGEGAHGREGREADAVEAVRSCLSDAVSKRLVADVPLGVFLSGGVDSSAVACLAQRASERPIRTFNVSFDESAYDESPHARAVAEAIGSEHQEVRLSEQDFVSGLPEALSALDQPTFDAVNTWFVSHAVREAGLTVALAGTGGDELFGGYSSFRDLPRARRAMRGLLLLPTGLRRRGGEAAMSLIRGDSAVPPQTRWGKLADVLASDGSLLALYQLSSGLFTDRYREALSPEFAQRGLSGIPPVVAQGLSDRLQGIPDLEGTSALELAFFLGERLLRDTDVASMSVSLEVRVPFVDHRLIEAVGRLPASRRYEPVGRKMLLRELGTSGIDPAVFDRPKAGFELPFEVWCRRQLRTAVDDVLRDPECCARVGLAAKPVSDLWQGFCDGRKGIYWSRIWALYVLMDWSRRHDISL